MSEGLVIQLEPLTALDEYINAVRPRNVQYSGELLGLSDTERLRLDIVKVMERVEEFMLSPDITHDSQLVLGRIQSGKTAHMLGVIAALVNSSANLVIVFSGVTGALSKQTEKRFNDDLGHLRSHPITVLTAPTIGQLDAKYANFRNPVEARVRYRENIKNDIIKEEDIPLPPLPVITVLQSAKRVEAAREIVERLYRDHEIADYLNVVIIDDEADQASQNAKASKGGKTAIFEEIEKIITCGAKNCLLSYTATPQAIMLAPKNGALRPRLMSVIGAGAQYFGVGDVLSAEYAPYLKDVPDDYEPEALRECLLEFFIVGLIKRTAPEAFYNSDDRFNEVAIPESLTVQMLVHPSSKTNEHKEKFDLISHMVAEFRSLLGAGADYPNPDFVNGELHESYRRVKKRLDPSESLLPTELPDKWIVDLAGSLSNRTQVLLINSKLDADNLPTDDQWEKSDQWILVGGDILGRGVTIPSLVTSFITRASKNPNFDTLHQQMRFCGYRKRYWKSTSIWLHSDLLDKYVASAQVDRVFMAAAQKWDSEGIDLIKHAPNVPHVQDGRVRMGPTKKGVMPPGIKVKKARETTFQTTRVTSPILCRQNSQNVSTFVEENSELFTTQDEGWIVGTSIPISSAIQLLQGFKVASPELEGLDDALFLFNSELGELGFGDSVHIVIRNIETMRTLAKGEIPTGLEWYRSISGGVPMGDPSNHFLEWERELKVLPVAARGWFVGQQIVPPLGETQRNMKNQLQTSAGNLPVIDIEVFRIVDNPKDKNLLGFAVTLLIHAAKDKSVKYWVMP